MFDQQFDNTTLSSLRERVLAAARKAGLSSSRAFDVMLALHELAANAVRHGAGSGWVRMRRTAGELYCAVTDAGPARAAGSAVTVAGTDPWPCRPGHGLWLVRQAADRVTVVTGPAGSEVTAVFALPTAAPAGLSASHREALRESGRGVP